jgi:hypothetical protein
MNLNEQYQLTEKAQSLDEKYGLKQKVTDCATKATELGTQALQTSYGQRVSKLVEYVLSIHSESKKLAVSDQLVVKVFVFDMFYRTTKRNTELM